MTALTSSSSFTLDSVLGTAEDGTNVIIDVPVLIGQHTLVTAQNGAGKSAIR